MCCGHLVRSRRALCHLSRERHTPLCRPGSSHVRALLSDVVSGFFSRLLLQGPWHAVRSSPRLPSVPHALCFRRWPFSARHHRLVAAVTQSSEDVLVSAGAVQAVPADAAVLDNRKDRTLP